MRVAGEKTRLWLYQMLPGRRVAETLAMGTTITPFILIARALSHVSYFYVILKFGVTPAIVPLLVAWSVVTVVSAFVTNGLENALVPLWVRRSQEVRSLWSCVRNASVACAIVAVCAGGMPTALKCLTNVSDDSAKEAGLLLLAFVPYVGLSVFGSSLRALGNADGRYLRVVSAQVVDALVQLLVLTVAHQRIGVWVVPLAFFVGTATAIPIMAQWVGGNLAFRATGESSPAQAITLGRSVILSQVVATGLVAANPLVDQMFAASLGEAEVVIVSYASRIALVPPGLMVGGMLTVFLGKLSQLHAEGRLEEARGYVAHSLILGALVATALSAGFFRWTPEIIALIPQLGGTEVTTAAVLCRVSRILIAGTPFYVAMIILGRVHIAALDYRAIWIGGLANSLINVVLNYALVSFLGIDGIAVSTTLDYLLVSGILWSLYRRRLARSSR